MTTPTYTHITASGLLARIVCTDRADSVYPVVALLEHATGGEQVIFLTATLASPQNDKFALTPLPPYHDFKIDEPVMVRDGVHSTWRKENFAGVREGYATTWESGTKWSSLGHVMQWRECRRPTPEELESV